MVNRDACSAVSDVGRRELLHLRWQAVDFAMAKITSVVPRP